ncbi:MAG: 6-bladed beta-propeller [Bacteroides sp.]|nr:6-bladed beta-propeller [Bacteroides sp.]
MLKISFYSILFATMSALCFSCSKHKDTADVCPEQYSTDNTHIGTINDVFSDVELTELAFDGKYYPKTIARMLIESDKIFIGDNKDNVYVYSLDGSPISSSLSMRGEGPGEHPFSMGFSWNPHSGLIEILTPESIMFYDEQFNFVKSSKLETRVGKRDRKCIMFYSIFDITSDLHLLSPTSASERPLRYVIYNSAEEKNVGEISYEDDVWWYSNMQYNKFFKMPDGQIICHPGALLPYSYVFDPEKITLSKLIELKSSGDEISREYVSQISGNDATIADYLIECEKSIPLTTIITPVKLLVTFKRGNSIRSFFTVIFNRNTDESSEYKFYDGDKRIFPTIMDATEDYAYSILEKSFIEDNPSLLLNRKEKIAELSSFDDESWVLLKYKFKD